MPHRHPLLYSLHLDSPLPRQVVPLVINLVWSTLCPELLACLLTYVLFGPLPAHDPLIYRCSLTLAVSELAAYGEPLA